MATINKETQKKNLVKAVPKILKIMRWKIMKNFQKLTKETFITLAYVMFMENFLGDMFNLL